MLGRANAGLAPLRRARAVCGRVRASNNMQRRSHLCTDKKAALEKELLRLPLDEQNALTKILMENASKLQATLPATPPTRDQLGMLFIACAMPMVGFGFVDNAIMIAAGEYIEVEVGSTFHLSTMAAAGIGNLISDVFGLGFGGVIESMAEKMGFKVPNLTPAQMSMASCRLIRHSASVIGISIGCILGMFPLLFYNEDVVGLRKIFNAYDHNRDGTLEKDELRKAFLKAKMFISEEDLDTVMDQVDTDKDGFISFEEFCTMYNNWEQNIKDDPNKFVVVIRDAAAQNNNKS